MATETILLIVIAILFVTNIVTLAFVGYLRQQLRERDESRHIEQFDEMP